MQSGILGCRLLNHQRFQAEPENRDQRPRLLRERRRRSTSPEGAKVRRSGRERPVLAAAAPSPESASTKPRRRAIINSENLDDKASAPAGEQPTPETPPGKVRVEVRADGFYFCHENQCVGPFRHQGEMDQLGFEVDVAAKLSGIAEDRVDHLNELVKKAVDLKYHGRKDEAMPLDYEIDGELEKWTVQPKDVFKAMMAVYAYLQEPEPQSAAAASAEDEKLKSSILGVDVFNYLMTVLGKTVKRDEKAVGLELLHMLSAYTSEPANIGVEAPTSEGKTYPAVQVAKLFPKEDVFMLGALSPTALAHDYGVLVDKDGQPIEEQLDGLREELRNAEDPDDKAILKKQIQKLMEDSRYLVNLEAKILIFLEDPQPETWARLRPILSHDVEETAYKFTDRAGRGSPLRQVTVVLRGWPVAVYFRAVGKASPFWDQMATRFTTISPEMTSEKYREAIQLTAMKMGLPHSVYVDKLVSTRG